MKSDGKSNAQNFRQAWSKALYWTERHVPIGLRSVLGIVLIIGGIFGFLPVLGFWMIPLGLTFIALDLKVISRRVQRKRQNQETQCSDVSQGGRSDDEK